MGQQAFDLIFTNFPWWKLKKFMTTGKRISRRTFWAQLQGPSLIRLEDIEGQSKKRHWNRIEIMPYAPPIPPHVVRVYDLLYEGYHWCKWRANCVLTTVNMSYVLKTWTLCTFLSQYVDDNNGWKLFFNSRGRHICCYIFVYRARIGKCQNQRVAKKAS